MKNINEDIKVIVELIKKRNEVNNEIEFIKRYLLGLERKKYFLDKQIQDANDKIEEENNRISKL